MTHQFILWAALLAYGLHMVEETVYDWRGWVGGALGIKGAQWSEFYVVNAVVVVMGVACANVGWRCPAVALLFPAFMATNAIFFHILPTIRMRRFSPGLITAVVLFLPTAVWLYYGAYLDRVLSAGALVASSLGGAATMFGLIVLQKTKARVAGAPESPGSPR